MAIFGNFSDIPIPDVISLIGNSTGTLTISRYENQHIFTLGVQNAVITRVVFNNQEVANKDQANSFITELIQANEGGFEFKRENITPGSQTFPLNEVLNSSLALIDEIQAFHSHFPDPHTQFIKNDTGRGWLNTELSLFWQAALPYFQLGASALDIQEKMGLYMDQILLKFYKLRTSGYIIPQRTFQEEPLPERVFQSESIAEVESNGHLSSSIVDEDIFMDSDMAELAASLSPIWQADEPAPAAPVSIQEEQAVFQHDNTSVAVADLRQVTINQPSQNTVKNLMQSIWTLMGTKK